jgi:hypothetical protein
MENHLIANLSENRLRRVGQLTSWTDLDIMDSGRDERESNQAQRQKTSEAEHCEDNMRSRKKDRKVINKKR